jgi:hypothetical protein
MKKIIVVLLFAIPCLCFGQIKVSPDIKVEDRMKMLSTCFSDELSVISIFDKQEKIGPGTVHRRVPLNYYPAVILVDGIIKHSDSLQNLNPKNIKSISVIKENPPLIFSNRFEGIILITTKGNTPVDPEFYELKILDAGYESFLITQKPKNHYSMPALKAKNALLVNEWNNRYRQPLSYNPNIYEVSIDYDANKYYGQEFEYRLYMFFKFMEKEHHISLSNS